MSHRRAKKLRKFLRMNGEKIGAEPYMRFSNGMIIASEEREKYQQTKRALR